jgi:hypothetical protein
MESLHSLHESIQHDRRNVGLMAIASSGSWDLSVDQSVDDSETINSPEKWFAQFEGPSFYLYFQIEGPHIVHEALNFLETRKSEKGKRRKASCERCINEFQIGHFSNIPVTLIWDEEGAGRLDFFLGDGGNCMRSTIAGGQLNKFTSALRRLSESLKAELSV